MTPNRHGRIRRSDRAASACNKPRPPIGYRRPAAALAPLLVSMERRNGTQVVCRDHGFSTTCAVHATSWGHVEHCWEAVALGLGKSGSGTSIVNAVSAARRWRFRPVVLDIVFVDRGRGR